MNTDLGPDKTASENSVTQLVHDKLRELILTGELAPGEKLKINAIREKLGVGASPVREALSLLTSDQLVVRLDQRGFRAAETSRENFQEILTLRCELESMALRQSMDNLSEDWAEQLLLKHHRMTRASTVQHDVFEELHKAFHMALVDNCQSPLLIRFCSQLYDLNIRYRYIAARTSGYAGRKVGDEHQQILNAVLASDFKTANQLLLSHYQTTGAYVAKHIH